MKTKMKTWTVEGDGATLKINCVNLVWYDDKVLIANGIKITVDFIIWAVGTNGILEK